MNKRKKQFIALVSIAFVLQFLFPQVSHAAQDSSMTKDSQDALQSVVLVKNSPQSILIDGDESMDFAKKQKILMEDKKEEVKIAVANNGDEKSSIEVVNQPKEIASPSDIKEYVLNEARKRGLSTREVEIIVNCESRWDPKALHKNTNGSIDAGLWQINSIHKKLSYQDKMDYKKATEWALNKRVREGNWSAWYCARKNGIN